MSVDISSGEMITMGHPTKECNNKEKIEIEQQYEAQICYYNDLLSANLISLPYYIRIIVDCITISFSSLYDIYSVLVLNKY